MVNINVTNYKPIMALVFYKNGSYSSRRAYVMQHDIQTNKHSFMLGNGQAITTKHLTEMLKSVVKNGEANSLELLNPNLLAHNKSKRQLVWFQPQMQAEMFMKAGRQQLSKCVTTCWPAMLFAASGKKLSCFALPKNERPNANTELMHAPFGNVFTSGNLCTGNAILPKGNDTNNTIERWNDVFYRTEFTHPNGNHTMLKGVDRDDMSNWWTKRGGLSRFPYKKLVPAGITLQELIERMGRHE